jgi:glutamate dehydrogenase/leucine dehydrogenase
MTLKYGFLGLPQGGAKAGVIGNPEAPRAERLNRLVEFGHAIKPLLYTKTYIPNADMGTYSADIRHMLNAVGIRVGCRELQDNSSGYYTAQHHISSLLTSCPTPLMSVFLP